MPFQLDPPCPPSLGPVRQCESIVSDSGVHGICRVEAKRSSGPVVLNVLVPTILFVLIAILSLHMDVKLAMPRVGATLFALLIVTQVGHTAPRMAGASSICIYALLAH